MFEKRFVFTISKYHVMSKVFHASLFNFIVGEKLNHGCLCIHVFL